MVNFVELYDTTLRDGTQMEGLSLSCEDKLRIAEHLDRLGITYIEGGWPGSNPKDVEFFERARDHKWQHAKITAFGSTRRANMQAGEDPQLQKLLDAHTQVCTIFGKSWLLHVKDVLRTSPDENIKMIEDSVAFLKSAGRHVIYDAEHFFDGFRADEKYALETLCAAQRAGADVLVLCDTNGGSMPWDVEPIVQRVVKEFPKSVIGVHVHNDGECGVANSMTAIRAGARHVQGTINGYGERCGNANLCSIIPNVELKLGLRCLPEGKLPEIYDLAHYVAEIANLPTNDHAPYVGRSAFAHKGGVHVAATERIANAYQHVEPQLVGNESRVVVSELSGRSNVTSKAQELGVSLHPSASAKLVEKIKQLEAKGFAYEAAEASVALLMAREDSNYKPPFEVLDFQSSVGRSKGSQMIAKATVKVRVGDEVVETSGEGNGPVSALDAALRSALQEKFPQLAQIHLTDYKVRILDGRNGTRSTTRVLIDSASEHNTWSTVGASSNIIEASLQALTDSIEYGLQLLADSASNS